MGICLNYVSLAKVPPMALVRARLNEGRRCPAELVEHSAGFDVEVTPRLFFSIVPGERVLEIHNLYGGPDDSHYPLPGHLLLFRALTELGGKQTAPERVRKRFKQRFEFEGSAPAPLQVHEQILLLGGHDIRPPEAYEPWFEFFTVAPDDQTVLLHPQPPWLHMIAAYDCVELFQDVYNVLLSFGARPRPDW